VALQCGQPCLSADEISELGNAAKRQLGEAFRTGQTEPYGRFFVDRLGSYTERGEFDLGDLARADRAAEADMDSIWLTVKSDLDRTRDGAGLDAEAQLLARNVEQLKGESLFFKYALWEYVFNDFEKNVEAVKGIRPDVDEAETPVAMSRAVVSGVRARTLTALWRDYFNADGAGKQDAVCESIHRFQQDEAEFAKRWEQNRREAMAGPLVRLGFLGEHARAILASIQRDEQTGAIWPSHLAMREQIELDVRALNEQLDRPTFFTDARAAAN
jgi:hypothetical protein